MLYVGACFRTFMKLSLAYNSLTLLSFLQSLEKERSETSANVPLQPLFRK